MTRSDTEGNKIGVRRDPAGAAVVPFVTRAARPIQVPLLGMTEQLDLTAPPAPEAHDAVIAEALTVIDTALGQMMSRELVSSGEVADLLLDVRTVLTAPAEPV